MFRLMTAAAACALVGLACAQDAGAPPFPLVNDLPEGWDMGGADMPIDVLGVKVGMPREQAVQTVMSGLEIDPNSIVESAQEKGIADQYGTQVFFKHVYWWNGSTNSAAPIHDGALSVATGDDFRAEFSVRGSDFRQMGFAVDGVPAPWLVHGPRAVNDTGTVAMVNAEVLSEIALTSGASPQVYGPRTGAWVQSTMREGSRDAVRFTGSLSGTGVSGVAEGPLGRSRRGAWLFSARKSYIDWLIARLNLDRLNDSRFGFTDTQSAWVYDVTPTQQVRLSTVVGRSRYRETDTTPSANGLAVADASTGFAVAAWRSTIGPSLVVTQRLTGAARRYQNRGDFDQELDHGAESTAGYRIDATLGGWHGTTIDLGGSADRDEARYRTA